MRINQNIFALNAQRNLQSTNNQLSVSLERLSSGLRINRASDDAAGLAISEKLRAQVSGLGVSVDNANDGISLIRTAEGSLDRVNAILKRMRDLVGWAANGDKTDADRQKYQDEINQLTEEINRISTTTEYNTKKLLNGEIGTKVSVLNAATETDLESIGVAGNVGATGTYEVSVSTAGRENMVALGVRNTAATLGTSLNTALNETALQSYTKTLIISQADGKSATVTLDIADTGDTIETTLNKLNTAFQNAGMSVRATFDENNNQITLASTEIGTKYNISWSESNSISTTYGFSNAYQLNSVNLASATAGTALTVAFGGGSGTYTFTFGLANGNTVVLTAADTLTVGALVTNIQNALNDSGYGFNVTVSFDDTTDKLLFTYGAGSTKVASYSVGATSGTLTSGAATFGFNSTDKVSVASRDVTVAVKDPVGSTTRYVTSTSRYFKAGTGGPNVNVDASGISGVTFTLTNEAAKSTSSAFSFDLSKGSIVLQIGPNAGTDHRMEISINDMSANALGVNNINVTNQADAQAVIDAGTIDQAIEKVVTERGKLGAYENRLNHTIKNLGVEKENLTSAESRLRDADIAQEMMEFTRNQIMLQAGTAMLAQANTVPQTVLQLLR